MRRYVVEEFFRVVHLPLWGWQDLWWTTFHVPSLYPSNAGSCCGWQPKTSPFQKGWEVGLYFLYGKVNQQQLNNSLYYYDLMFYVSKTKTLEQKVSYCEDYFVLFLVLSQQLWITLKLFLCLRSLFRNLILKKNLFFVLLVQRTLATLRGCFFAKTMTFPLLFNISAEKCNT